MFQISLSDEEYLFLARKLSEASLVRYGQLISEKWVPFTLAVEEFIEEVSDNFNFHLFCEDDVLFEGVLNHLRPAYKRTQSFEIIENPLFKYVYEQYGELHKKVIISSSVLESRLNVQFSLQELSFFTLFFAASYERNKNVFKRIPRAILVCSAGISTSQMLKSKLVSTFQIHIEGIFSTRGAKEWLEQHEVDMILTTVPFNYKKVPSLLVTPYLSKEDKKALEGLLQRLPSSIQTKTLLEIIKAHATIEHPQQLKKELQQYLGISHTSSIEKGAYQPMLLEVITEEMIHVNYDCQTRDEAVIESGRLLVEKGYATEKYIKAMLKNVEENGTYIVIAPGIAMPHARPEEGAVDIGLSIVTLKNPVVFGHPLNDPVRIVVGLCAVNHQSHLKALSELVEILGNQEKVEQINEASTSQEIINIIKGGNKND
ncbi:PTS sugar transporter subunit IIA (plasmid) [Jeotgalibaca sp. MA1X17-3]|uniref:BglG family transcription antiterminator n=1 Tax=Jeotgalibaca sp. MA1X17-3 TaxID=2908211 RepID=UPI001F2E3E83|nr:PTS sugar transporter subunit IIA [Jeotgalibaca sp. MA1X17-3]UJF16774.1 PTS sugar transporter subunit IIA [Jeotgalibaca sp. MA1X17-3]